MRGQTTETRERPARYSVAGFIPRDRLTPEEVARIPRRAHGLWIPVHTLAAWSARGAVKKALDQGYATDPRMTRFRASLETNPDGSIQLPLFDR